ncbi:hypothetical protein B0H34DRAFT_106280 [Crassisporium funariophilum]|nr:hypothetical protein B0H34DRAFT_106280 [Crassisporium funariophilum]
MVSVCEKGVVGTSSRIAFYDVDTDMEAAVGSGTSTALIPEGAPMSAISPRPAHLHLHLPQRALSLDASAEMSIDSPTSSQYLLVPPSFRFPSNPSPASGSSYYADGRRSDPFVTPPLGSASMSIDSPLLSPITNRVLLTVEEKAVRSRMKKVQLLGRRRVRRSRCRMGVEKGIEWWDGQNRGQSGQLVGCSGTNGSYVPVERDSSCCSYDCLSAVWRTSGLMAGGKRS